MRRLKFHVCQQMSQYQFCITVTSRSCSGAPSISDWRCSGHVVNALRTEICLCGTNGCNGIDDHKLKLQDQINSPHTTGDGCIFQAERILSLTTILFAKSMN